MAHAHEENDGAVPNTMISMWMPESDRQITVAAHVDGRQEVEMEVTYEPQEGPFRYAALVRRAEDWPVIWPVVQAVTIMVKDDAPFGTASINRKALAEIPLAELLRSAADALHWDLQSWANGITRFPPPPRPGVSGRALSAGSRRVPCCDSGQRGASALHQEDLEDLAGDGEPLD